MKQWYAFVMKEFYHILRDRRTMLILLGMPVVQILLFGFAITTEVKNVRVGAVCPSKDIWVSRILNKIDASEYFDVTSLFASPQEMDAAFRHNDIDVALLFSSCFGNDLNRGEAAIQIVADATDSNMAVMRSGYLSNIIASFQREVFPVSPGHTIIPSIKLLYNPQMKSAYNFVPGVMGLILMLICAMMTSISIVREKEMGTMELLLVSPVKPFFVLLSKAIPYLLLSLVNLTTILCLSVYVLHVPIAGNLCWIIVISLLYIFVSLALGLLISSVTHTQIAAMVGSAMMLLLPTIFLSGLIFPLDSMPSILQAIACIIPARWYIDIIRKLMIEGVSVIYVWKELLVLIVMAIALLLVSMKLFKNRLE